MSQDRMFRVLVLGGVALVGGVPACGDPATARGFKDASSDGPTRVVAEASVGDEGFPSELPSSPVATDGGVVDAFPGPADASSAHDAAFPVEVQ
jgi:hypothetical protein